MGDNFSIRKASTNLAISKSSVHRILKTSLRLKNYHFSLHQELNEDAPDRRLSFCEDFIALLQQASQLMDKIIWTDEAKFFLNGSVNRRNCVYWSDQNEHRFHTKSMDHRGVTVWAGISEYEELLLRVSSVELTTVKIISPCYKKCFQTLWDAGVFMQDGAASFLPTRHQLFESRISEPLDWSSRKSFGVAPEIT